MKEIIFRFIVMNDDNNNSDLNPEALAIDEPGVHIVNEPLIPAQIIS